MRDRLIQQLNKEQSPIAIILDGSTARRVKYIDNHFLSFTFNKRSTLRFVFSNTLGTHDVW